MQEVSLKRRYTTNSLIIIIILFFETHKEQKWVMAEFDAAGFSEFDQFFGGNDAVEETSSPLATDHTSRKGKRGGVGAVVTTPRQDHLSKSLLRVGSKRSREEEDEDDEVETRDEDDGLDDEAGRTGIPAKEKKKAKDVDTPQGGKKLGKKERQRIQQKQESSQSIDIDVMEETSTDNKNNNKEEMKKTKSKRRKVRSRQKNIRKDSRSIDEKPKHLHVGASNYKGRPLTEETRGKLSLPPSKSTSGQFFVVDRSPVTVGEEGVTLGVEDLLEEESNMKKLPKASKQQKKKKKYKNL